MALDKSSFLELHVDLDVAALVQEVDRLPSEAWSTTYWGTPHGSIHFVLLRGGTKGHPDDFLTNEVADADSLARMPLMARLIGPQGPFRGSRFAFLFRMLADGVTLAHTDSAEVWGDLHRVHVPLVTHPSAHLVVEGRAQHLSTDSAWTFDNQALHGFVNGPCLRTHLIVDVPETSTMAQMLLNATHHAGRLDPQVAAKTLDRTRHATSYPGDAEMADWLRYTLQQGRSPREIVAYLRAQGMPTRVHGATWTVEEVNRLAHP
jgi:hypothetical protein